MAYLSLAEFKQLLGITGNDEDTLLSRSLSFAATIINGYLGWDPTDVSLMRTYTTMAEDNQTSLQLPIWPAIEVASVVSNGQPVVGEAQDAAYGWWLDTTHGIIEGLQYLGASGVGRYGRNRVTVNYRAGYFPTPQDLKDVALNIASAIYNNGGEVKAPASSGGSGELKSLTMFDAMSMSFDVGGSSSTDDAGGALGMVEAWAFVLDRYKVKSPALA